MQNGTKLKIAEALMFLLQTKDIQDITTQEIACLAGVSKRTFYNHFCDKNEVLAWFWSDSLQPYWDKTMDVYHLQEHLFLRKYRSSILHVITYNGQNCFLDEVKRKSVEKYRKHISRGVYDRFSPDTVEFALHYSNGGIWTGILIQLHNPALWDAVINLIRNDPDTVFINYSLSMFTDHLSYEVLPEGEHI